MVLEAYANDVSTRKIDHLARAMGIELFESFKARGLSSVHLIVSDTRKGFQGAMKSEFLSSSWQRCRVHFMRNVLARAGLRDKEVCAAKLEQIWLPSGKEGTRQAAREIASKNGP